MKFTFGFLWLLSAASACAATMPEKILECRALSDAGSRLRCYDGLSVASATSAAIAAPEALVRTQPAGSVPAKPPVAPAGKPELGEDQFGKPVTQSAPDFLETTIPGQFRGWEPNEQIVLANGQVWRIIDGSRGAYSLQNPKIRIRRGISGAFFLEIEGENKSPKVRRVK